MHPIRPSLALRKRNYISSTSSVNEEDRYIEEIIERIWKGNKQTNQQKWQHRWALQSSALPSVLQLSNPSANTSQSISLLPPFSLTPKPYLFSLTAIAATTTTVGSSPEPSPPTAPSPATTTSTSSQSAPEVAAFGLLVSHPVTALLLLSASFLFLLFLQILLVAMVEREFVSISISISHFFFFFFCSFMIRLFF